MAWGKKTEVGIVGNDSKGRPVVGSTKLTKHQARSAATLIPLMPAPKTKAQKAARALWG